VIVMPAGPVVGLKLAMLAGPAGAHAHVRSKRLST